MSSRSSRHWYGPRSVGGFRATYAKWVSNAYRYAPVVVPLALWFILTGLLFAGAPGGALAGLALTVVILAAVMLASWRHRLKVMQRTIDGFYLPFWTHVAHLVRAWRLYCFWARAVASVRMTEAQRGVTVLPPPRPLKKTDGVWWLVDGDGTIHGRVKHAPYGVTHESLSAKSGALSEYLGAYEVGVRNLRRPAAQRGKVLADLATAWGTVSGSSEIRVYYVDSIGRIMYLRELPAAPEGKVAFGRHADRSCAYVSAGLSTFIMGMTGAGKSNILWTMLADLRRSNTPVRLYVSDPKGGQELSLLGERVGDKSNPLFEVRQYAKTVAETAAMIASLRGAMQKRQTQMGGARKHTPTTESPLTILVIDEFLGLGKEIKGGADSDLGLLLTQGRSSGFIVIGLAQASTKDVLGELRDLFPQRIALKLPSPASSVPALGIQAPCHLITEPGVGYVFKDGEYAAVKFRAPFVTDPETERIARGEPIDMPGDETGGTPTTVYRFYGRLPVDEYPQFEGKEVLLYIGKSVDFPARRKQHEADKAWADYIDDSKTRLETWPTEQKALIEETKAIKAEGPIFNVKDNGANPIRQPNRKRPASDPRRQAEAQRWTGTRPAARRHTTKRKVGV